MHVKAPASSRAAGRGAPGLMGRLALAAIMLILSACAGPKPLLTPAREAGPQWPEAPFAARIQWVKSVATPEDAGIGKSVWKKALELVTGADVRQIVKPYGVLYDDAGRLLIADAGAGVVHLMDSKKGRYTQITAEGGAPFGTPIGLAEDEENRLYITDSAADIVYRYDLERQSLTPFLRGMERPTGIAYNKVNKMLYISETTAHRVTAVDLNGTVKFSFGDLGGPRQTPFNLPTDVATDAKGQVYVTDPLNYMIKIFTPEGVQVTQFGEMGDTRGELNKPKGIAVDPEGRIYLCDALLDTVQIFDDQGQFLFSFGATGSEDGAFWMPSGLYIHGGYIFVSDSFNQRVQIFRYLSADADESKAPSTDLLQTTKR
jgi:DNA-binding beta-propeller fold protein YncE